MTSHTLEHIKITDRPKQEHHLHSQWIVVQSFLVHPEHGIGLYVQTSRQTYIQRHHDRPIYRDITTTQNALLRESPQKITAILLSMYASIELEGPIGPLASERPIGQPNTVLKPSQAKPCHAKHVKTLRHMNVIWDATIGCHCRHSQR